MEIKEILIYVGFVVIALIGIVRIIRNIQNGRKWWEGFPTGE
ncbi:hypothetical protein N9326_04475 [Flavobacteriaceae bacterium]|mgnify:CR=1|jgi:TRAP-type mannitol/chloroaromatic compound transport system permease small subunit|nr:hypothetical protein [Flavobacteriaceae bacterium]|tara:strand:- start:989 stop:1114 length:126 start_codon:yes stop_codon:yes gene_type:complete